MIKNLHVKSIDVDSIKIPDGRFRKEMGDLQSLADSMAEVGQLVPILITPDNVLVAGERRLSAAKLLHWDTIEALTIDPSAIEIDNRVVEAYENIHRKDFTWQEQVEATKALYDLMVAKQGKSLSTREASEVTGLSKTLIHNDLELVRVMQECPDVFEGCKTKKSALKALQRYKIDETLAEITLRKSKTDFGADASRMILKGDCLKILDELPDASFDAIITDPPYGLNIEEVKKLTTTTARIYEDDPDDYVKMMQHLISKMPRVLKQDAWVVIFCAIQYFYMLYEELKSVGFSPDHIPIICTNNGRPGQTNRFENRLARSYDVAIYAHRGNATLATPGASNLILHGALSPAERLHPVEKSSDLMEKIVSRFCISGMQILDPFCGSGTTIIAAIKQGCTGMGVELDDNYYNTAIHKVSEVLKLKHAGRLDLHGKA